MSPTAAIHKMQPNLTVGMQPLNKWKHEPPKPRKSEGNLILHCENYSGAVTVKLIQVDLVMLNYIFTKGTM